MTVMHFERDGRRLQADLADPLPIAIPLDFDGPQATFLDVPQASSRPVRLDRFVGDTRQGGSCNCEGLSLLPHCNGTHTECVGHLTDERVSVSETLRGGMHLTLLLSVKPVGPESTAEGSDPEPVDGDLLVTAEALGKAAAAHLAMSPEAVVVRTLPNSVERMSRRYTGASPAPFLSREATEWLVAQDVRHLVLDLPSADRASDAGRMTAHRVFFGLPPGSRRLAAASRPQSTITELAFVAPTIHDGWYLLDLQVPAFLSDAAPSRPLLYPVRFT